MKPRYIILTIDTITELIKDYVGLEELPADARAVSIQMNADGKLAITMISDAWTQEQDPINVNFKIKRMYGVL